MQKMIKICLKNKNAQTAMELAVFGAIIVFILGAIVRQGLMSGYQQNQTLKAMRIAMNKSFLYSEGVVGRGGFDGESSRNFASIMIVEDRLTSDSAKFTATERVPLIYSATAAHTRNLILSYYVAGKFLWKNGVDSQPQEDYHLPVFDLYVNNRHFPLRVAGFKKICFKEFETDCGDLRTNPDQNYLNKYDFWYGSLWTQSSTNPNPHPKLLFWDPECGGLDLEGCAILYTQIPNSPTKADPRWCNGLKELFPAISGGDECTSNLSADQRFDLDRDGFDGEYPDVPDGLIDGIYAPRYFFGWQWYAVLAMEEFSKKSRRNVNPRGGQSEPEPVIEPTYTDEGIKLDGKGQKNGQVSVDQDSSDEQIVYVYPRTTAVQAAGRGAAPPPKGGVFDYAMVVDSDFGDVDFNQADASTGVVVGLTGDSDIYTKPIEGTYLRIEEGKLYDSNTNQFVRSVQKSDHIDIISRKLQLTRNTGRFCSQSGGSFSRREFLDETEEVNPVDVCVAISDECTTPATIEKTCMADNNNRPIIYIRSKPIDKRGHKWITDISEDRTVDFKVPAVP